jgi:hypothetical protein
VWAVHRVDAVIHSIEVRGHPTRSGGGLRSLRRDGVVKGLGVVFIDLDFGEQVVRVVGRS